jgi:hypothetical protein
MPKKSVKAVELKAPLQIVSVAQVYSLPPEWRGCLENGDYFVIRILSPNQFAYGQNEREIRCLINAFSYQLDVDLNLEIICEAINLKLPADYINLEIT